MKPMHGGSEITHHATGNNVYYVLTLDPSVKDHRVIALLINYTSRRQECPFYEADNVKSHCSIAPDFTVMWNECGGRCFVSGITCPLIVDRVAGTEESPCKENSMK